MTETPSARITRRNFLQILLATGAGVLATGVLQALKSSVPISTPIKNIIFFTQENHSFDSLFAGFPGANSKNAGQRCTDSLAKDPPHNHADAFQPDGATTAEARCSYQESDAPNYWKAARAFTLCDNYFSDVRGPSYPNFLMMIAAQSPIIDPPTPSDVCPGFAWILKYYPTSWMPKDLTWKDYGGIFTSTKSLVGRPEVMIYRDEKFFEDAAQGTLPNIAWLNSGLLHDADAKSGHPPSSLCLGENYAVSVLNAVMNGPQWLTTALFLVWDEWGGFYDHVEPPVVEKWKDGTPSRYGHRVPGIVISPYARSGYVSHNLYSHVSLLRFAGNGLRSEASDRARRQSR